MTQRRALDFARRNAIVAAFRSKVRALLNITLFPHQAAWQLASEGLTLIDRRPEPGDTAFDCKIPDPDDLTFMIENRQQRAVIVPYTVVPRPFGPAHYLVNLAAYKGGKSYGGALWLSGFGVLPAEDSMGVQIIGAEYTTSEPEFNYLCEIFCSERGLNMKAVRMQNNKRQGQMLLQLPTGAKYEVKSWESKEGLKGKKVIAYYYAEAYQLPGLEVFTSLSQNLRELQGFAAFTTTPDTAWVGALHDQGHGKDPDWHCTCGVDSRCNVYTYDQKARDRDDPDKNGIMTRERFAIAHLGLLGHFVGRVYDVQRGQRHCTPGTHPELWKHKGEQPTVSADDFDFEVESAL